MLHNVGHNSRRKWPSFHKLMYQRNTRLIYLFLYRRCRIAYPLTKNICPPSFTFSINTLKAYLKYPLTSLNICCQTMFCTSRLNSDHLNSESKSYNKSQNQSDHKGELMAENIRYPELSTAYSPESNMFHAWHAHAMHIKLTPCWCVQCNFSQVEWRSNHPIQNFYHSSAIILQQN